MYETTSLLFFRRVLEKMRIHSHIFHHQDVSAEIVDFGLRKQLGREYNYAESIRKIQGFVEKNTVYKLTDPYFCKYIFLLLPEPMDTGALIIGPYISHEMSQEQLLEEAERMGLPASDFRHLENFYRNIPALPDDTYLMTLVTTLAEDFWGSEYAYKIVDLVNDTVSAKAPIPERKNEGNSVLQMRLMEQRYAYENELLDKVSKGLWHRVNMMLFPSVLDHVEHRTVNPVRSYKNYCIICNTLLRKAAEKGGVHPLHLDKVSSQYAGQIELIGSAKEGDELIQQMAQAYCRLVRQHNIQSYSAPIQKVVTYIEAELSSDLSLRKLASLHNISPEYLSSLFHKETQMTLTQFINEKRITLGASLLRTTSLQIQTISEYCGFPDAGYFAKLFKKRYGVSPTAFREQKDLFPV